MTTQAQSNGAAERHVAPTQKVRSTADGYTIELELPGVAPEAVDLELTQGVLKLTARPIDLGLPEGARPLRTEFAPVVFAQRWRLPKDVDQEAINTSYRAGILTIELPQREPETTRIQVIEA